MNPEASTSTTPAVPLPPGGPIEIVFSFDTTGSMSECLEQVRGQLAHVIERLNADIPGLRMAVFAHGDYCDLKEYGYVTKHVDFTNDVVQLCQFVSEVNGTGGGDFEECYELVLREVREQLSWQPGTQRALVMIGDATPHEVDNPENIEKIDWRAECERLANEMGVRIYAVQCLNNSEANDFFGHLAESSGGRHLKLDELTSIVEMMMAICYREKGVEFFEDFEKEIRQREGRGMRADLERMFGALKDGVPPATPSTSSALGLSAMGTRDMDEDDSDNDDAPAPVIIPFTGARKRAGGARKRSGSVSSARSSSSSAPSTSTLGVSSNASRTRVTKTRGKNKLASSRKVTEKALRENLQRKNFVLGPLRWSHWREAMVAGVPEEEGWRQRKGGSVVGSRCSKPFPDMSSPAVYEIAVQPATGNTKVPVLASVTGGLNRRHWERAFMSQSHIQKQVDSVLQKGCKLYVRRARFATNDLPSVYDRAHMTRKANNNENTDSTKSSVRELRGLMTKVCDYAWNKHKGNNTSGSGHRTLHVKGVTISE